MPLRKCVFFARNWRKSGSFRNVRYIEWRLKHMKYAVCLVRNGRIVHVYFTYYTTWILSHEANRWRVHLTLGYAYPKWNLQRLIRFSLVTMQNTHVEKVLWQVLLMTHRASLIGSPLQQIQSSPSIIINHHAPLTITRRDLTLILLLH